MIFTDKSTYYGALGIFTLFALRSLHAEVISYTTLGDLLLRNEPNFQSSERNRLHSPQDMANGRNITLDIKTGSLTEQKRLCFLLLDIFYPLTPRQQPLDLEALKALSVITHPQSHHNTLLNQFHTRTLFGRAAVTQKLALPQTDRSSLKKIQRGVQFLVSNPHIQKQLLEGLQVIAKAEGVFLALFSKQDRFTQEILDSNYFSLFPQWNKSPFMVGLRRGYQVFQCHPQFLIPKILWQEFTTQIDPTATKWGKALLRIYNGIQTAAIYLQSANYLQLDAAVLDHITKKLQAVVHILEGLKTLADIVENSHKLKESLSNTAALHFDQSSSDNFSHLIALLQTDFNKNRFPLIKTSYTLVAFKLIETCQQNFLPALAIAGEIDALCAASRLYLETNQTGGNAYCFVDFIDTINPLIKLKDAWNPLLDPHKAVVNSVNLGGTEGDHNLLISGPNGTGKSIFMKSMALNIILAQSFGIAAAHKAQMSVFDTLNIYLNVQESLELSLSTFMAEKKKLAEIFHRIASLPSGQKSFTLIDEGLKGTIEQVGGKHMHEAGMFMSKQPGNICLLATHFNKPIDLERDTVGAFTNYHVELLEQKEGEFLRTFKLIRGKSEWWLHDEAKRERFILWLTKTEPNILDYSFEQVTHIRQ